MRSSRVHGLAIQAVVAALVVAAAGVATSPSAFAVAPWTFVDVSNDVTLAAGQFGQFSADCPSGTTAVSGGWGGQGPDTPIGVERQGEYIDTGGYTVDLWDYDVSAHPMRIYARCATASFPTAELVSTHFAADASGRAGGYAGCPSGRYALQASAYWNNTNTRVLNSSAPTWDLTAWYVVGHDDHAAGADLTVDVECVAKSDLPALQLSTTHWDNTSSGSEYDGTDRVANCPAGTTVLSGGTFMATTGGAPDPANPGGFAFASFPSDNGWKARSYVFSGDSAWTTAWCIPASNPTLSIGTRPPAISASSAAQISFQANDPAGYPITYACRLDSTVGSACTSPATFSGLADGPHTLLIVAQTSDGRSAQITISWRVDTTNPTVHAHALPEFALGATAHLSYLGADPNGSGVANYDLRFRTAPYAGAFGAWTYPPAWQATAATEVAMAVQLGGTLCLEVRARDIAGNLSSWSAATCTARPLDDPTLTPTSAWTRITGAQFYNQTATATTTRNAQLSLTNVTTDRLGIVATTCPSCGMVDIRIGNTDLGTINLASAARHYRRILALPSFAPRTGVVAIQVLSSGKQVQIDGLATSHA